MRVSRREDAHEGRRGSIFVMTILMMSIVIACLAFSIDLGYIALAESELQNAADAGALSGARALEHGSNQAITSAESWLQKCDQSGSVGFSPTTQVDLGYWNKQTRSFSVRGPLDTRPADAVRVTCGRMAATDNPLNLFVAPLLGRAQTDVSVTAVAHNPVRRAGTRFLIDDEMIDTDVLAFQQLAQQLGRTVDELLTPRGFNLGRTFGSNGWTWEDHFLDLPHGQLLSLPTGQGTSYSNNDAGLFTINHSAFPFAEATSFQQFLTYSETGNDPSKWGYHHPGIASHLDPLSGASPVMNANLFESYVDPNFVHISPVHFSDVNTLAMQGTTPRVNAKGLRRGLIAFRILDVGTDIDGAGSVLPELIIETVDPRTVDPTQLTLPNEAGSPTVCKLVL